MVLDYLINFAEVVLEKGTVHLLAVPPEHRYCQLKCRHIKTREHYF